MAAFVQEPVAYIRLKKKTFTLLYLVNLSHDDEENR